ncbi:hypothetical protein BKG58_14905 [Mycobacteroides abscessus subsp. abscessus]|nr:hypothetical protein BKG58_14905 [Mycobacteroides abscessus subsp. abscessus]
MVGDGAQPEGAYDGVEAGIVERQSVGVGPLQNGGVSEIGGAVTGQVEYLLAPVDAGRPDSFGAEGQVEASADRDFQNVAGGLAADPLAGVAEQVAVEEPDLTVIVAGFLVPVPVPACASII